MNFLATIAAALGVVLLLGCGMVGLVLVVWGFKGPGAAYATAWIIALVIYKNARPSRFARRIWISILTLAALAGLIWMWVWLSTQPGFAILGQLVAVFGCSLFVAGAAISMCLEPGKRHREAHQLSLWLLGIGLVLGFVGMLMTK